MATQPPQSLPSFAQAFGAPSLSRISDANNALPPIQSRASPFEPNGRSPSIQDEHRSSMLDRPPHSSRKRSHPDSHPQADENTDGSLERRSPRSVRIKQESEFDDLPSPTARNAPPSTLDPHSGQAPAPAVPPPSSAKPSPSKKRRVTISGISHPINTDVRTPATDATKSISPVVMGLPINRDDAAAIEQVRSMLSIKQQQKELIESRRGSTAGILTVGSPSVSVTVVNTIPHPSSQERDDRQHQQPKQPPPPRTGGRSPNPAAGRRRSVVGGPAANAPPPPSNRAVSPLARQPSPPPPPPAHVPAQPILQPPPHSHPGQLPEQQQQQQQHGSQQHGSVPSHGLPAPPISFARRRATRTLGGAKGKPADIMISPRDANAERLQPSIQSAPPVPRASISQGVPSSRFPGMTLPSLPPVLGPGQGTQRMTAGRVPPTPTRLSIARTAATAGPSTATGTHHLSVGSISTTGRSPPTASVPISTTLVPPTPSTLANPNYTTEKSAFLAPFEMFYDALADSKTLKGWLGEQLQKSHALTVSLQRQQEHLDEIVAAAVQRQLTPLQEEIVGLHRRIEDLEHALQLHSNTASARPSLAAVSGFSPSMSTASLKGKAKANGVPPSLSAVGVVPETYTFPPVEHTSAIRGGGPPEQVRRALSPTQLERESESRSFPGSQTGSPVPYDMGRRLSVSAIRLDPRGEPGQAHRSSVSQRERDPGRDRDREPPLGRTLPPPPSAAPGGGGSGGSWNHGRPWSPRSSRVSLPAAPSASARASIGGSSTGEKPGLVRRSSAQRLGGEGYGPYADGGEGRSEGGRERERESHREREREREASPPPRREVRSPEPMEE